MAKTEAETLDKAARTLAVAGALNWGLVGLFRFDLVAKLFGRAPLLQRLVYTLVGAGALYTLTNQE